MEENKYHVIDARDANFKIRLLLDLDETPEILKEGEYTLENLAAALDRLPENPGRYAFVNRLIESGAVEGNRVSLSEATEKMWKDPEYRERMSEATEKMWKDPEFRERMRKATEDPEHRKRLSESHKEMWKDPEYRKIMIEMWKDPEFRERMSEARREMWKDPEYRERMSEARRERGKDPENRKRITEAIKVARELRDSIHSIYNQKTPQEIYTVDRLYNLWLRRYGLELWKKELDEQIKSYEEQGKGRLGLVQDMVAYRDTKQWRGYFLKFSKAVKILEKRHNLTVKI